MIAETFHTFKSLICKYYMKICPSFAHKIFALKDISLLPTKFSLFYQKSLASSPICFFSPSHTTYCGLNMSPKEICLNPNP